MLVISMLLSRTKLLQTSPLNVWHWALYLQGSAKVIYAGGGGRRKTKHLYVLQSPPKALAE